MVLYTVYYVNYVDCGTAVAAFKIPKSGPGILQSSQAYLHTSVENVFFPG